MALFENGQSQDDKAYKILAKYGLENIDPQYADAVRKIATDLAGSGLITAGTFLGSGNEKTILKNQVQYMRAMVEQNFIIIRELDQISYLLEQRLQ